jgi:hypothetical protein
MTIQEDRTRKQEGITILKKDCIGVPQNISGDCPLKQPSTPVSLMKKTASKKITMSGCVERARTYWRAASVFFRQQSKVGPFAF